MKTLIKDSSLSAIVAGCIATMISYAGPLVIIFHAAEAAGLSHQQLSSWVWAVSMGSAVLGALLSLRYRVPVVIAWSIPGSALLVSALPQLGLEQAVGAYLVANLLLLMIGISGAFDRIIARLPGSIAAGMQAGILFSFGIEVFRALPVQPVLELASPQWVTPQFSLQAVFSLALPMVLVALTGQFMPGMAVLRNAGYPTPASPLISASALAGALLAPFGCHGLNLAAVTASLCTGPEAHENPRRRYVAAVAGSALYLLLGIAGATLMSLFAAFPAALVAALAGLALYGAISEALARSLAEPAERDAGLFTFLVTASGVAFLGLSAAFWGLLFGLLAHALLRLRQPRAREVLRRTP
ncbi:benzoate/H(+) symporter BenE family transporter [Pseudomonas sp. NPDC089547]|uniref:benzoate/H(+) symporter BenE family transporter n=1 Tax=Pseudomonas sp. NPDC089547 TaxID=3390652 RepID=UPI003D00C296